MTWLGFVTTKQPILCHLSVSRGSPIRRPVGRLVAFYFVWGAFCILAAMADGAEPTSGDSRGLVVEHVLRAEQGRGRALLIGVDDYERLNDLRYCEEDVQALGERLVKIGYHRDAVKCLTTGDSNPANRPAIGISTSDWRPCFQGWTRTVFSSSH